MRADLDRLPRMRRLWFRLRLGTTVSAAADNRLGWDSLFKALGSLGGLAALTYLIGLMPYWIRLSSVGYPADVALQVANQQQILQQGLSPALIWTAITGSSAVILLCSLSTVRSLRIWWISLPVLASLVAVLGFTPLWRIFGFVVGMFLAVACGVLYVRIRGKLGVPRLALIAILAAAIGVCFYQVGEGLTIEEVLVTPPVNDASVGTFIPYFGEQNGYVYLGEPFVSHTTGAQMFTFRIITCRRDSLNLTFVPASEELVNPITRNPWSVLAGIARPAAASHATPTKTEYPSYAACGTPATFHASSANNAGVIPVPAAGIYTYSLSTPPCNLTSTLGPRTPALRLVSDNGEVEYLAVPQGNVYLTPGNWTGTYVARTVSRLPSATDEICAGQSWSLALTVSS
jgi:hypothetical protein